MNITKVIRMDIWDLLETSHEKKIIKGYVLYKNDTSTGENYSRREGINYSANVATVYASLLKGVLVEESLEKRIKQSGLKKLKDARNESRIMFQTLQKQLNRSSAS